MVRSTLKTTLAFALAVAAATALGAIVQTQLNLAALQDLGVSIPAPVRIETTLRDLVGFTPRFGAIVGAGFAVAFAVAEALTRRVARWRRLLFAAAGAAAILTALAAMNHILQIFPIAAARTPLGVLSLAGAGAIGGWVFAITSG